jgi:hypothetical protein
MASGIINTLKPGFSISKSKVLLQRVAMAAVSLLKPLPGFGGQKRFKIPV